MAHISSLSSSSSASSSWLSAGASAAASAALASSASFFFSFSTSVKAFHFFANSSASDLSSNDDVVEDGAALDLPQIEADEAKILEGVQAVIVFVVRVGDP